MRAALDSGRVESAEIGDVFVIRGSDGSEVGHQTGEAMSPTQEVKQSLEFVRVEASVRSS